MNVTSRIESNGRPGQIQLSQETADLVPSSLYVPREDKINAKGKGVLSTYWLKMAEETDGNDAQTGHLGNGTDQQNLAHGKLERLVDWNVDVFKSLLQQCIAIREMSEVELEIFPDTPGYQRESSQHTILDEVREVVEMPTDHGNIEGHDVELSEEVEGQLRLLIQQVAGLYNDNPFHNFEHASHVTMSVLKLLSRIRGTESHGSLQDTHDMITHPRTQLACMFAALIHDLDHPGVSNRQLVKEQNAVASFYKNRSVAEQNSVEIAWDLLQDDSFGALRAAMHGTLEEMWQFRQIFVNAVMATDIMDDDLKRLRNGRWQRAFADIPRTRTERTLNCHRKATIVLEHLMQASDVAHTMQHWQIYLKWNERLLWEIHLAHSQGRAEMSPWDAWYEGECQFLEHYVVPLARKLKECGVFGVSGDEFCTYGRVYPSDWIFFISFTSNA